jgi:steroid delta-isomerase-like uncharacterized protein
MRFLHVFTILVAIVCLTGLAGCSQESKTNELATQNKAVVMAAFEALNNFEYDRLGEFIAPNYIRHCQATPDIEVKSLDDFIAMAKMWESAFPDMKGDIHTVIAEGDMVAFYATYTGTHKGPMGEFPATGKTMVSETFGFHRLEEGKIVETWVTWDNLIILNQLGLFPPAAEQP